jgi:hypothetical protein
MKKTLQVLFCVGILFFTFNQAEAQKKKKKKGSTEDKATVVATNENPETLLQRKWQLDGEFLKAEMKKEADKVRATNPDKAAEIESQMGMIDAMAAAITMEFKNGGAIEVGMMGGTEKGSWKLEEGGKILLMTNSSGKADRFKIKELSKTKLLLENPEDTSMPVMALKPAQ